MLCTEAASTAAQEQKQTRSANQAAKRLPKDVNLQEALQKHFGFSTFLPGQQEVRDAHWCGAVR